MICFLTSNILCPDEDRLNPDNRFTDELKMHFPEDCNALFICSDPLKHEITDYYANIMKNCFEEADFRFQEFLVLDGRNQEKAGELVSEADLIILSGGHVPTQNRFFHAIGLKDLLKDYAGIIIGISAGSMNSADIVYAQPELEGETLDPDYQRFMNGLDLTKIMIVPHYQDVKDDILDGKRLFEDITYADSKGRSFYAFPDGSYLLIRDGKETIRGEAYLIRDGILTKIAEDGDEIILLQNREKKKPCDFINDGNLAYDVEVGRFLFEKEHRTVYALSDFLHVGPSDVFMCYQISKQDYERLLPLSLSHGIPQPEISSEITDALHQHFLCGESAYCKRNAFSLEDTDLSLTEPFEQTYED